MPEAISKAMLGADQYPQLPALPRPPGAVPPIPVDYWKQLAAQTRHLNPQEQQQILTMLAHGVDPNKLRVGLDPAAIGTALAGWSSDEVPGVVFMRPGEEGRTTLPHEATHVWQMLTGERYTNPQDPTYLYEYDKGAMERRPFQGQGREIQAGRIEEGDPEAQKFLASHHDPTTAAGWLAFLDSIRERYRPKGMTEEEEAHQAAYSGKPTAFSDQPITIVKWTPGGKGRAPRAGMKNPFESRDQPRKKVNAANVSP